MKIDFMRRPQPSAEGAATLALAIDGMHCNSCAMSIDWEVEELDGVSDSSTSFAKASTRVTYDPSRVAPDAILAAVERAGFTARPIDGRPPTAEELSAMETVTFDVPAITCGHCVATIKRVVTADVPGVREVTGDPDAKRVTVAFDAPATVEQIVATMTEWDYPPAV